MFENNLNDKLLSYEDTPRFKIADTTGVTNLVVHNRDKLESKSKKKRETAGLVVSVNTIYIYPLIGWWIIKRLFYAP
jgi:hypothetical protein